PRSPYCRETASGRRGRSPAPAANRTARHPAASPRLGRGRVRDPWFTPLLAGPRILSFSPPRKFVWRSRQLVCPCLSERPLLARNGLPRAADQCPLFGSDITAKGRPRPLMTESV